ncbi:hypothetical protein B0H14DRAFT_2718009 [Mycena olivaceomarginata]|nr:hypothetical protein B0H14DRAFT_2718009 [Mycena olivaceomarginata]
MQARYLSSTRTLLPLLNTPLARRQLYRLILTVTRRRAAHTYTSAPPAPDIYANFHRTTLPIAPWSTDWETCDTILFFTPSLAGTTCPTVISTSSASCRSKDPSDPSRSFLTCTRQIFCSRSGGEYYEIDDCYFVRYGGGFTGPDDFLRQLPHLKRLVEEFPDSEDDLYFEACREQRRLVEASGQKLYN